MTENTQKLMDANEHLVIRPNKVILKQTHSQTITIPSKMYPLQNKKTIQFFHSATTEPLSDDNVIDVFDSIEFEVGRCYGNMEKLEEAFKQAGLGKDLQVFTGWMVMPNDPPIHHAWAMYKDVHLIDPAARIDHYELLQAQTERKPKEQLRKEIVKLQEQAEDADNHDIMTFGQSLPIFIYIGSETTPNEGRTVFNKLTQTYPNHPSYAKEGMNQFGESTLQSQLRKQT